MKNNNLRFLSLFLLLFCSFFYSQNNIKHGNEKTYTEFMDDVLENLITSDKDNFKNGILYDRVYPMSKLNSYNTKNNSTNYYHFTRAWEELYKASNKKDFLSYEKMREISFSKEMENKVTLGAINIDFTEIDSMALSEANPKLEIRNNKLSKIKGKMPFVDKHLFIISPLNTNKLKGNYANFEFGELFIDKSNKNIKELVANFENNQTIKIISNGKIVQSNFKIKFSDSGLRKIKFEVDFQDKSRLETTAELLVENTTNNTIQSIVNTTNQSEILTVKATKPYQGYEESGDCGGSCFGEGEYKIFFGNGNTVVKKPFIIVDGFDPNDSRKIDTDKGNIAEAMDYGNSQNLIRTLNNEGYDVIILNFPNYVIKKEWHDHEGDPSANDMPGHYNYTYRDGGVDYIQRNAKVLEALIDKINIELINNESTHKLKIAGPSMGALIVQYALAEMEKNNENHNTDLYISFDGPHNGANAPIGVQKAISYFDIAAAKYALDNPSAKQMLINHYLSYTEGYPLGAPNFRDRFQNELNILGFPKKCRNIASINGSVMGELKAIPSQNFMHVDFTAFVGFLRRNGDINYSSDSGQNDVFRYKKENWWGANTQDEIIKRSSTNVNYGSLDNSPGGYLRVKGRVEEALQTTFPIYSIYQFYPILKEKFKSGFWAASLLFTLDPFIDHLYINMTDDNTFVPTKSALAFKGSPLYKEKIGCRNLVCTKETPFDSYFAPQENQEHASLHQSGVNWLLEEVKGNPQLPTVYNGCNTISLAINGENVLCNNTETFYTINSSCYSGVNVNWQTSDNLQIIYSNNSEIKVRSINVNNHPYWIKAILNNGQVITKNIISTPQISYNLNNSYNFSEITLTGQNIDLSSQNITNIVWEKIDGNGNLNTTNNSYSASAYGIGNDWYVYGKVTIYNSCGSTSLDFYLSPEIIDPCSTLLIAKENTNEYRIIDPCLSAPIERIDSAELYDISGLNVKNIPINQNRVNLNNKALKGTLQILKVTAKGRTATKRIIID